MPKDRSLEKEIWDFLQIWTMKDLTEFLRKSVQLYELFAVNNNEDWLENIVGSENEMNVRLIRTVYLISKIAEFHAGKLCQIKIKHKDLWLRLEKIAKQVEAPPQK